MRPRIIPVLLVENGALVKTIKFNKRVYLGDPINTVKLYNDMEVDEIIVLDITASKDNKGPNFELVENIRNEAFMPFAYGGGITSQNEIEVLINSGIEKVVINTQLQKNTALLESSAKEFGSQSLVASVDINLNLFGKGVIYSHSTNKNLKIKVEEHLMKINESGAGEIFLNFVYRDGTWSGYDLELTSKLSRYLSIPLIVCGGASSTEDLKEITTHGADAAAAGSLFSFSKKEGGVLINYPESKQLDSLFYDKIY